MTPVSTPRHPTVRWGFLSRHGESPLGLLFVLGSLLLGSWALVTVAREQAWWARSFEIRFRTADATGIWPGVFVTISGYRVGKVETVRLGRDGVVSVNLRIQERYRPLVGPGSRVSKVQEGLIGDTVIRLSTDIPPPGTGTPRMDLLLPFDQGTDVGSLLEDLARTNTQLNRALRGTAGVVEKDLPGAIGNVNGTLSDIRRLAGRVGRETESTAAVTRETLTVVQQTGRQLEKTTRQLEGTGREVMAASDEATVVLRDTAPELRRTLRQVGALASTANRLLKALGGGLLLDPGGPEQEGKAPGAGTATDPAPSLPAEGPPGAGEQP